MKAIIRTYINTCIWKLHKYDSNHSLTILITSESNQTDKITCLAVI